ncbi:MAG: hypothetical protein PH343_10690 [Nitrospira sp.]|nr:hypothetical protein [Nitrospira sp.]
MSFVIPEPESPRTQLADWLELKAIATKTGEIRIDALWDAEDFADDFQEEDIEDSNRETLSSKATEEILCRCDIMKESYPFTITADGRYLQLKDNLTPGGLTYILCLRLSLAETDIIDDGFLPEISTDERYLFQICSTICTAGFLGGSAVSIGWPRKDKSSLLSTLSRVQKGMNDGVVHSSPPAGAPKFVKDDEVDVIGWASANDDMPGMLYLFGQAASGKYWPSKPLSNDKIWSFNNTWYIEVPGSRPLNAIFLPFCLFENLGDIGSIEYNATFRLQVMNYGIIFYRYRIPFYVEKAIALHKLNNPRVAIDHIEDIPLLISWWEGFKNKMLELN